MSESEPVCTRCQATSSVLWQRDQQGAIICLDCHTAEKTKSDAALRETEGKDESGQHDSSEKPSGKPNKHAAQNSSENSVPMSGVTTRRTTRSHERAKARQQQQQQQEQQQQSQESHSSSGGSPSPDTSVQPSNSKTEGTNKILASVVTSQIDTPSPSPSANGQITTFRSRRSLMQAPSVRAAEDQAYLVTSTSLQHKGVSFEVGDVVSVLDRDGGVYYAIAHGFVVDQYAEKYALLTWLLPKTPNPMHFDPAAFILGPEDDTPRAMNCIEFVCHSPQSRHFQSSYSHNITQAELWLSANQH